MQLNCGNRNLTKSKVVGIDVAWWKSFKKYDKLNYGFAEKLAKASQILVALTRNGTFNILITEIYH